MKKSKRTSSGSDLAAEFDNLPATAKRAPASTSSNVTFSDYMNQNASNPALNGPITNHQNAFVDTAQPAVITFPTDGGTVKESETNSGSTGQAGTNATVPPPASAGVPQGAVANGPVQPTQPVR